MHGAYANYRKSLLANGVKLFELKPEVVPQDLSLFGSSGASEAGTARTKQISAIIASTKPILSFDKPG